MNHLCKIVILGLICSEAGLFAQTPSAPPDKLHELEKRVNWLEKRVAELETKSTYNIPPRLGLLPKNEFPVGQKPPSGWQTYEFLGQGYYLVPLGQNSK